MAVTVEKRWRLSFHADQLVFPQNPAIHAVYCVVIIMILHFITPVKPIGDICSVGLHRR